MSMARGKAQCHVRIFILLVSFFSIRMYGEYSDSCGWLSTMSGTGAWAAELSVGEKVTTPLEPVDEWS